ncbi:MAG: hypothetical protein NZ700_15240 [Gemmataceae bacterium]|nr:hypothetical protein [Gemmataceae bacterium]MDW8265953.1 hypothetical protein [Gemmataceae bacterium]
MRRCLLLLLAIGIMATLATVASSQRKPGSLLVLDWAGRASLETPPTAVLLELGLKDTTAKDWSGQATVTGAKVVRREGYRFRKGDALVEPDGWQASSHRPIRGPGVMPKGVAIIPERIAAVGIVLHLTDIQPQASLTVRIKDAALPPAEVPLKDVLAGQRVALWNGQGVVRRVSSAMPLVTERTEDDFPAAAYGPDGTLWLAYISYHVKDESRRIEAPQLTEQPTDFKPFYTPEYRDQLFVKYLRQGRWSAPVAVTGPNEDLVRCALAVEGNGRAWVAYAAHRPDGTFVYARSLDLNTPEAVSHPRPRLGDEVRVLPRANPALGPVMCTQADGSVLLACQRWEGNGHASVALAVCRDGQWQAEGNFDIVPEGNAWYPAVAGGPSGAACAADHYADGDYDVVVRRLGVAANPLPVAASSHFEARPSLAYDPQGRLWIAYEFGPPQWGKDFGALVDRGNPMYFARTIRVVCLHNGQLFRPAAELPPLADRTASPDTGQRIEGIPRYAYPRLGIDGKGRLWLTYRVKFGTRYSTHPGSYWLTFARRLDGDHWTEPIEVHHSDGLLDDRPVLLPHKDGGLLIIHNTDGRFTTPEVIDNQIYLSHIDLPGEPVEPKLLPHEAGTKDPKLAAAAAAERQAVAAIRGYRLRLGTKIYQLLRGEFHRHTEISWDGGSDGSLEDMWRYGIDAAALDWIGNGDHDNGAGREYPWWLIQKTTDAYHIPARFTPLFTYERSVSYPHGHRNCMFAQRGVRTLPRLKAPSKQEAVAGVHADDTKMLYRYLRELNGICAVHTSATSMGTDWRDNDPQVEPFVEIYQGDRMSYEMEEAPRAGYDPASGRKPANIAGWYPKGFINHALDKGYRLGFQASSDHFSTHISYCIAVAERHDRQAIVEAFRKRHCYAATDNIILDVRSGEHMMGDAFTTPRPPTLSIHVEGTAPVAQIDILRDCQVVATLRPNQRRFSGTWTDPQPLPGTHHYYVRVMQADEELAWGSPMWIEWKK